MNNMHKCTICSREMSTLKPRGKSFVRACEKHGTYEEQFLLLVGRLKHMKETIEDGLRDIEELFDYSGKFKPKPGMKLMLQKHKQRMEELLKEVEK